MTAWFGRCCFRKIGGITGDTLGANVQLSESIVLLVGLALS
jgi:cobalamin synthase